MPIPIPPTDCSIAREAASALLDGELSELEAAHLDGHLRTCVECSGYAREIGALAARVRSQPLEIPTIPVFAARRRRPAVELRIVAAAAAVVLATGASFAVGHTVGSSGGAPTATVGPTVAGAVEQRRVEILGMLRRRGLGGFQLGHAIPV